jgi:hypothetical protein
MDPARQRGFSIISLTLSMQLPITRDELILLAGATPICSPGKPRGYLFDYDQLLKIATDKNVDINELLKVLKDPGAPLPLH